MIVEEKNSIDVYLIRVNCRTVRGLIILRVRGCCDALRLGSRVSIMRTNLFLVLTAPGGCETHVLRDRAGLIEISTFGYVSRDWIFRSTSVSGY